MGSKADCATADRRYRMVESERLHSNKSDAPLLHPQNHRPFTDPPLKRSTGCDLEAIRTRQGIETDCSMEKICDPQQNKPGRPITLPPLVISPEPAKKTLKQKM